MSFKIIGAILVVLGCGGFGFMLATSCKLEEKAMRQLSIALEYMECEIRYRLTPLPELCSRAASHCNGYIHNVLIDLSAELQLQKYPNVQDCMTIVLTKVKGASPMAHAALQRLGRSLGRFDLEGQLKGIQSVQEECKHNLQMLTCNQAVRLRSYQTLGLCAGAALAIIFI